MKVSIEPKVGTVNTTENVRRVEFKLSDGQRFTIKEIEEGLSVTAENRLIVCPRAANLIWLEDQS